ncbi:hypothetical protein ACFL2V_08620 [Pseudomonadota bacterium]
MNFPVKMYLCILLTVSMQHAMAGLPNYYPEFFPYSGTVSQVNTVERYMVVNDAMFRFSGNVHYHTPNNEFDSLAKLSVGDRVGCRYVKDARGRYIVTDIWLLPEGQIPLPMRR